MLENLHVKDLALIEEAEVEFKDGFNILTGETGAGKSIILGSINLALGAKASSDIIRSGKESALVELSFKLNEDQITKIRKLDLDVDDDGEVLLQRKISAGKNICRMNGETISVGTLKSIAGILLDMYGQHEHQTLLKASTYSKMLDEYAGDDVGTLKAELADVLKEYHKLVKEKEEQDSDTSVRNRELELLSFEVNEIEDAALKPGEDEELEKQFKLLNNSRKMREIISEVISYTGNDSDVSASTLIGSGVGRIRQLAAIDDEAGALATQLAEIEGLLDDFNRELSRYESKLDFDDEDFEVVSERLNLINKLKGKYGDTIEKILKALDEKSAQIDKLQNYEAYLEKLNKNIELTYGKAVDICKKISVLRKKAAPILTEKLIEAMKSLNFLDVKLSINIDSNEEYLSGDGYDNVEFLISLNPGEDLKPMQNVASGGELSRIMLAFKSVFAESNAVSTLIFDEIDTGISGVTAYKVAEMMDKLSKNHQLICITHLPQIAAMADRHFLIEKGVADGRTLTNINALDEEGSVRELARMLGSDVISESALANARELKGKDSKKEKIAKRKS